MTIAGLFRTLLAAVLALAASFLSSCSGHKGETNVPGDQSRTERASKLKIWDEAGVTLAAVYDAADTASALGVYIFSDNERATSELKKKYPRALSIRPGQDNLLIYTTVHASVLEELGALHQIGSVVDAEYFSSPAMRKRLDEGTTINMGSSSAPVKEKLIAKRPALAVVSRYSGMDISILEQLGIPVMYMAENQEFEPLGRAEWIKLLGLLADKEEKADSIYNSVRDNYLNLTDKVKDADQRPKIMTENMYQGIWYVAGGASDVSKMIADAGGIYAWADDGHEGSLSLSFESVLSKGGDSDIWLLKVYGQELSESSLLAQDNRYALFKPFKDKGIWYSNTAESKLFDEVPFHPDRLLEDYICIFHPESLPGHKPRYYKPIRQE